MKMAVARLSSKGQIVIPAAVRRRLGLCAGDELRVSVGPSGEQTIILIRFQPNEIQTGIERGYRWLERARADPVEALHESRRAAHAIERRRP
jgi:AbrB family looped-hinge helix DNA binding protein